MGRKGARSASEKAFHQREIARLYKRGGKTEQEIADELKISQATVSRDLDEITKRWQAEARQEVNQAIADELFELDEIRRAAWGGVAKNPEDPRFLAVLTNNVLAAHKVRGLDKLTIQEFTPEDMTSKSDEELARIASGATASSRRS